MAECSLFNRTKLGELIPVTARQLESFILEHNGKFDSRDYGKFVRMELTESPVRDTIHELRTYSLETLVQCFGVRLFGCGRPSAFHVPRGGKRVFARLDAEDDKWYYFSLAYIDVLHWQISCPQTFALGRAGRY